MANGGIAIAQTLKDPSVRWLVVHLADPDCILKSMLSKLPWKNPLKKPEVKENIIADIPLSITNLLVFLTETIYKQTSSINQKINLNLLIILLFADDQNGLKATIDDIACSIGSDNSSPTLSSISPRTSGPGSISSQLSKLFLIRIVLYIEKERTDAIS